MTAERALPMLKLSPTAFGCSSAEQRAVHHVVDVAPGADLRAVAVDRQVAPVERRLDERADRAAADLTRPEDVERAHRHGREAELGVVGVRHVLAGELRDGVRPARLADRADRRHLPLADVERVLPEHLARRELDHPLDRVLRRERRLERVVGADHVDAHRPHGAREHRVDAGDAGRVDDVRHALRRLGQARQVEHVALHEVEVRVVAEVGARERVAMEVVERDHLVLVDEPARERRPDEAGAAGDQDPLAAQSHAASLAAYPRRCDAPSRAIARARARVSRAQRCPAPPPPGRSTCGSTSGRTPARTPRILTLRCATRRREPCRIPPSPAAGCSALGRDAFRPTPPGTACTADLRRAVDGAGHRHLLRPPGLGHSFARDNGCEIARWQRVAFLLPPPSAP